MPHSLACQTSIQFFLKINVLLFGMCMALKSCVNKANWWQSRSYDGKLDRGTGRLGIYESKHLPPTSAYQHNASYCHFINPFILVKGSSLMYSPVTDAKAQTSRYQWTVLLLKTLQCTKSQVCDHIKVFTSY